MVTKLIIPLPEKRHSSTKSSTDRIEQLKAKIEEKFFAVESVMKSIEQIQDQMLHLTTEEYHKNVIEDNYNIAQMTLDSVEKLHCNAVLTLSATQVAESDVNVSKVSELKPGGYSTNDFTLLTLLDQQGMKKKARELFLHFTAGYYWTQLHLFCLYFLIIEWLKYDVTCLETLGEHCLDSLLSTVKGRIK